MAGWRGADGLPKQARSLHHLAALAREVANRAYFPASPLCSLCKKLRCASGSGPRVMCNLRRNFISRFLYSCSFVSIRGFAFCMETAQRSEAPAISRYASAYPFAKLRSEGVSKWRLSPMEFVPSGMGTNRTFVTFFATA